MNDMVAVPIFGLQEDVLNSVVMYKDKMASMVDHVLAAKNLEDIPLFHRVECMSQLADLGKWFLTSKTKVVNVVREFLDAELEAIASKLPLYNNNTLAGMQ